MLLRDVLLLAACTVAVSQQVELTLSPRVVGATPTLVGVNSGHTYDPGAFGWYARLGVNAARVFGGAGSAATLRAFSTGGGTSVWGAALSGTAVADRADFAAAVAALRAGVPPRAAAFAADLATVTLAPTGGSVAGTVAALLGAGIEPLLVTWLTCNAFAFSTLDQGNATYWGEHWELYKHQYTAARWAQAAGVSRLELWNEPDLNAECITRYSWAEHFTLLAAATQEAFADAGAAAPTILASAFAQSDPASNLAAAVPTPTNTAANYTSPYKATYPADYYPYLGAQTLALRNASFPPWLPSGAATGATSAALDNVGALSVHSYGKTGWELGRLANGSASAGVPFAVTEHAAHTTAAWNSIDTTADTPFEAARLAGQLVYMAAGGWESYVFKFSAAEQSSGITRGCEPNSTAAPCGVQKVGLHWGENAFAPFPVGDSTLSAEAARLVLAAAAGGHALEAAALTGTYSGPPPLVVNDGRRRTLLFVNDGRNPVDAAGSGTTPSEVPTQLTLAVNASAWGLPPGTPLVHNLAADGSFAEVGTWPLAVNASGFFSVQVRGARFPLRTPMRAGLRVCAPRRCLPSAPAPSSRRWCRRRWAR